MTTTTAAIALNATSTTKHHNWIVAFSAALDAVGLALVADVGTVVLTGTTTAYPTGVGYASTTAGQFIGGACWQIRKLVASGLPDIYLRFDFGVMNNAGSAASQYPAIQVSMGTGTDGHGNLTTFDGGAPIISLASQSYPTYAGSSALNSGLPSNSVQNCDFASDGANYLTIMMGEQAPAAENLSLFTFAVERSKDPVTFAYDNGGLCAFGGSFGGWNATYLAATRAVNWYYVDFAGQAQFGSDVVQSNAAVPANLPSISPPVAINNDPTIVNLFTMIAVTKVPKAAPSIAVAFYHTDIPTPTTFSATVNGTAHTYKSCPRSCAPAGPYGTDLNFALRFD